MRKKLFSAMLLAGAFSLSIPVLAGGDGTITITDPTPMFELVRNALDGEKTIDKDATTYGTFQAQMYGPSAFRYNFGGETTLTNVVLNYSEATVTDPSSTYIYVYGITLNEQGEATRMVILANELYAEGESQTIAIDQKGETYTIYEISVETSGKANIQLNEVLFKGTTKKAGEEGGDQGGDGTLVKVTPTSCSNAGDVTDFEKTMDGDFKTYGIFTSNTVSYGQYNFANPTAVKEIVMYFGEVTKNIGSNGYLRVDVMGLENADDEEGDIIVNGYVTDADSLVLSLSDNETAYPAYCFVVIARDGNATMQVKEVVFKAASSSKGGDGTITITDPTPTFELVRNALDGEKTIDKDATTYGTFQAQMYGPSAFRYNFGGETTLTNVVLNYSEATVTDPSSTYIYVYGITLNEQGEATRMVILANELYAEGESQTIAIDQKGETYTIYEISVETSGKANIQLNEVLFKGTTKKAGEEGGDTSTEAEDALTVKGLEMSDILNAENLFDGNTDTYAEVIITNDLNNRAIFYFEKPTDLTTMTLHYGTATVNLNEGDSVNILLHGLADGVIDDLVSTKYVEGETQTITIDQKGKTYKRFQLVIVTAGSINLQIKEVVFNGTLSEDSGDDYGGGPGPGRREELTLEELYGTRMISPALAFDRDNSTSAQFIVGSGNPSELAVLFKEGKAQIDEVAIDFATATSEVSDAASTKITIYGINLEGTNINCTEITTVDYEASLRQIIGGMNNKDKFDGCKIVISSNGDAKIYVTELSIRGILEDSGDQGGDEDGLVKVTPTSCGNASGVTDLEKTMDGDFNTYGVYTANTTASGQYNFANPTVAKEIVVHFAESTMNLGNYGDVHVEVKALKNVDDEDGEIIMSSFYYGSGVYFHTDSLVLNLERNETAYSAYVINMVASGGNATLQVKEVVFKAASGSTGGDTGGDTEDDDLLDPTLDSSDNVFEPAKATDKVDYLSAMFQLNGIKDAYIIYNFGGQTDLQKVKLTYGNYSTDDDVIVTIKVYGLVDYGMGLGAYEEFATTTMAYGEDTQTIDVDMKGTTCQMFKLVLSSNGNANIGIAEAQFYGTTTKDSGDTDGISTISTTDKAAQRYSLDGRRVDSNYKGIVIENGKKIFVK